MSVDLKIETTLPEFNRALAQYMAVTRRTVPEVLLKQGTKLGFALSRRFGALKPAKGEVRTARRAELAAGAGITVRKAARDFAYRKSMATASNLRTRGRALWMEKTRRGRVKRNARTWWQIAVDRELSIRESGRGYLGFAARMGNLTRALESGSGEKVQFDRMRREIGRVGLKSAASASALVFHFDNAAIVEGISRPRGRAAVAGALEEVRVDMLAYVSRKIAENAKATGMRS